MQHAALAFWVWREWRRSALAWLLGATAVAFGPLCVLLQPWGIVGAVSVGDSYVVSIWYLSTYLGTCVGLSLISRAGILWDELGPTSQATVTAAVVCVFGLIHGLGALGSLAAIGAVSGIQWLPALLCAAHWALLSAFVQRAAVHMGTKWLILSGLGWWIPAGLAGMPDWDRLVWLLSPARHLGSEAPSTETSLVIVVDTMPLVAWWVAAALFPTRSAFRR